MPDRLPTDPRDAEPRPRRRAARASASQAEALALVERAAAIPEGLALLERAPLECAAVLLGVDPRAVERARAALEDPALHEEASLRFERAADRRAAATPRAPAPPPAPRDPEALLAAARARGGGLAILLEAAPECAAIVFGVHPDLVHRARALAAREVPQPGPPPAT
jgi:hypothetical protein